MPEKGMAPSSWGRHKELVEGSFTLGLKAGILSWMAWRVFEPPEIVKRLYGPEVSSFQQILRGLLKDD